MQNEKARLTVLHNDNGTFIDHSFEALDYGRDTFALEIVAAEDKLFLGFEKPINSFYIEIETPNTTSSKLNGKYFDGTSFVALEEFIDDTKGFTRSGFVKWKRNQGATDERPFDPKEEKTTINGKEQFWYEFTFDIDFEVGFTVQGLNLVFSDDLDLKEEFTEINSYLGGEKSFILKHQSARNDILHTLRKHGLSVRNNKGNQFKLDQWDLLDIEEIRQASKFLVLNKIFFNVSDNQESIEENKADFYHKEYQNNLETYILSLDLDNDGIKDQNEDQGIRLTRIRQL